MYHKTPTAKKIDKYGLEKAMQDVRIHGYACRICDIDVSLDHPRDGTSRYWLSAVSKAQQSHNTTYHPCLDTRAIDHFSESVPWHPISRGPCQRMISMLVPQMQTPLVGAFIPLFQCMSALQQVAVLSVGVLAIS